MIETSINSTIAVLVAHILRTYPDLPVVHVGLEESMVHVYRSERVAATSTSFLDAVRGLLSRASQANLHIIPRTNELNKTTGSKSSMALTAVI